MVVTDDLKAHLKAHEEMKAMMNEPLREELEPYIKRDTVLGPWVNHPLVMGSLTIPGHLNRVYQHKLEQVEVAKKNRAWGYLINLHERPYRLSTLDTLYRAKTVDTDQLRQLLMGTWQDTELPHQFGVMPRRLFEDAGFLTDAPNVWEILPDPLTVYRGATRRPDSASISWSVARGVGAWFARRFRQKGKLWRAEINKRHVLAYIEGRSEAEVILNPRDLSNLRTEPVPSD